MTDKRGTMTPLGEDGQPMPSPKPDWSDVMGVMWVREMTREEFEAEYPSRPVVGPDEIDVRQL